MEITVPKRLVLLVAFGILLTFVPVTHGHVDTPVAHTPDGFIREIIPHPNPRPTALAVAPARRTFPASLHCARRFLPAGSRRDSAGSP